MDCLFCKIVEKKIPADIVYEDDYVLAFKDIMPQAPTHILIIPKKHISSIKEMGLEDIEIIGKLHFTAKKIADKLNISDYRLVINCGEKAGQTVFHIHLHLLAGRDLQWPPG